MVPSLRTSRRKGWSGAVLHSGMTYGARGRCCLCGSAGGAPASSISVSPEEAPVEFGAPAADEPAPPSTPSPLTLGLGPALPSAPASGCGAGEAGIGDGGGGIEEDGVEPARPSTSAADDAAWDSASGCGGGGGGGMDAEVRFGGGGGMEVVAEEEGLGFRGGGGGMEGSMVAIAAEAEGDGGELGNELRGKSRTSPAAGLRTEVKADGRRRRARVAVARAKSWPSAFRSCVSMHNPVPKRRELLSIVFMFYLKKTVVFFFM